MILLDYSRWITGLPLDLWNELEQFQLTFSFLAFTGNTFFSLPVMPPASFALTGAPSTQTEHATYSSLSKALYAYETSGFHARCDRLLLIANCRLNGYARFNYEDIVQRLKLIYAKRPIHFAQLRINEESDEDTTCGRRFTEVTGDDEQFHMMTDSAHFTENLKKIMGKLLALHPVPDIPYHSEYVLVISKCFLYFAVTNTDTMIYLNRNYMRCSLHN